VSYPLTELQLAIMAVLWERGEATVLDVHDALRLERRIAQSTVSTLLSRMEEKGVVTHRAADRQYVYRAAVSRDAVRQSVVDQFTGLADRLFSGDVAALVSQLLSARDARPEDLARAREIIERKERELREQRRARDGGAHE
jgi:predicted transcriptional regulator